MSSPFAQQQIAPPADWQTFERCSNVLWGEILNDPLIHRFGKLGQEQHGLDLTGYRDGQPGPLIGIQCKCIVRPGRLTKAMVNEEVEKAANYNPPLSEFILTTTADDDARLHQLAHQLTDDFLKNGRSFLIRVWGWGTIVDQLHRYPKALHAFDPSASPFAQGLAKAVEGVAQGQAEIVERIDTSRSESTHQLSELMQQVVAIQAMLPPVRDFEAADNAELDRYRKLLNAGKPRTALSLIREKEEQLDDGTSANVRSRLKMLAGYCCWHLGDSEEAIALFSQAAALVPGERRGVAASVLVSFVSGDFEAAYRKAVEALNADRENDAVVPWLIGAASNIAAAPDPRTVVPPALQNSIQFAEGYVQYLRSRDSRPNWWTYAREQLRVHPSSSVLKTNVADAELDEFTNTTDFSTSGLISDEWRERLASAVDGLKAELNDIAASENSSNPAIPGISCNLAAMLHVLERQDEAKAILTAAISRFPNDPDLQLRTAQIALETRDIALQLDCLPKLGGEPNHLLVKALILVRQEHWKALSDLAAAYDLRSIPGHDGALVRLLARVGDIRQKPDDEARAAIRDLASDPSVGDDQQVVVADIAGEYGLRAEATAAYTKAKSAIHADTHIASRLNFAFAAERREDWASIIQVLDGKINLGTDSPELRVLAHAHANRTPVSQTAIDFFEQLPQPVRSLPTFLDLAAFTLLKAGNAPGALALVDFALEGRPHSARLLLWKCRALVQIGRKDDADQCISQLEPSNIKGTVIDRLYVAHLMAAHGRWPEAISFGHSIVIESIGNAQAELLFCGLILNSPDDAPGMPAAPAFVQDRTWVRIVDQHDHADEFVIDSQQPRSTTVAWPADSRSQRVLGRRVGEQFSIVGGGFERVLTVQQIKHVFLYTLHFILNSFNDRHPGHPGLWQVPIPGNDVSPILEMMKRRADDGERISEHYERQAVPLEFIAVGAGLSGLDFIERLEERDFGLRTCVGTHEERTSALTAIESSPRGAVLDLTALWTALRIGAVPALRALFGNLYIAESTYAAVRARREELTQQIGRAGGTMGYHKGHFVMIPFDHPMVAQAKGRLEGYLQVLERDCERVSALAPAGLEVDWAELLSKDGNEHLADPVFIAIARQCVLLSEDLYYRHFAAALGLANTSWLQPALAHALDRGQLGSDAYAGFVLALAELRHGFVTLNAQALVEIARAHPQRFDVAARYIGGPNAEAKSHARVVAAFADAVLPSGQKQLRRALSALLARIVAIRPKDWEPILAGMVLSADRPGILRAYAVSWCKNRRLKTRRFLRVQASR